MIVVECFECDGLGFQDEEELEDIEIYREEGGFIYGIERYAIKYDVDLSVMAASFGHCYDSYKESWMLCPECDGRGK